MNGIPVNVVKGRKQSTCLSWLTLYGILSLLSRVEKEGGICGVTAKAVGFLCNMYLLHKPPCEE